MAQKMIKRKSLTKGKTFRSGGLSALVDEVGAPQKRDDIPSFRAGDALKVHVRIKEGEKERIQIFEGNCIKLSNRGENRSFTVRKISHGVGVERVFLMSSPKVAKVELVQPGKVRRAKLYYLRSLEGRAAKIERLIKNKSASSAKKTARASS